MTFFLFQRSKYISSLIVAFTALVGCHSAPPAQYIGMQPDYTSISIQSTKDTLIFQWDTVKNNLIRSFNYFVDHGSEYISFYDKHSLTLYYYTFPQGALVRKIPLLSILTREQLKKKTTVYVKNFDSLYIINQFVLYQVNREGIINDSLPLQLSPYPVLSSFENIFPPIFRYDTIFLTADPILRRYRKSALDKWKILAAVNFKKQKISFHYKIPEIYKTAQYPEDQYDNNYSYNDNNRFVVSFGLDTTLYETDLSGYHKSYYAKSHLQLSDILPISSPSGERASSREVRRQMLLSDTYGPVYFDPFKKRYLRVFRKKITEEAYRKREWLREQSIIIMDEHFAIIGESIVDKGIDLKSLFFTKDGKMYARIIMKESDDQYFIPFNYIEK